MTQDEIIEMVMQIGGCDKPEYDSPALKIFESFAKLVAQHEREACAKVCEQGLPIASSLSALDDMEIWGEKFAVAIRARGQA